MSVTGVVANPLRGLQRYGQSVWLDYIRRSLMTSGELRRLIEEDGLAGVTSNPSIFEKAIAGSTDYADALADFDGGPDAKAAYERIAIRDVQDAADTLKSVYDGTNRRDGYVSLEVSPLLARNTRGTLEEARRLWAAVARPNLMIKVPGTPEGIAALRTLVAEGINVNVTLLFSRRAYRAAAAAYMAGLADRAASGRDVRGVASVASFFVSRIDAAVESLVALHPDARAVVGKVAIANAKLAYQDYREVVASAEWARLAYSGAQPQRLLWASTSSKNPSFRDVVYVEELIGPDTVNTIPPATFSAFRDHGDPRASLTEDLEGAEATLRMLSDAGMSIEAIAEQLLNDGIRQFETAFEHLLHAVGERINRPRHAKIDRQTFSLPAEIESAVSTALHDWHINQKVRRVWDLDATLWTASDESKWLGWLGIAEDQVAEAESLQAFARDLASAGFSHGLLLGMGGSSLCPEVLRKTFGVNAGFPELHVLDSTDPAQVRTIGQMLDLTRTIFIVSSKSGGTLEPNIFKQYFFDKVKQLVGATEAGNRFVAVTDPGSGMERIAERSGFRRIFHGVPSIGGRYSALSAFGMVPAAIMGIDVARFIAAAQEMVHACGPTIAGADNPGVVLGVVLGVLARRGRDKVTFITSPGIGDLGAWLEQLIAESTGKAGKGIIPIDAEPIGEPNVYADDRVFAYLRLTSAPDPDQDAAVAAIERSGQPVIRISVEDIYSLGEEFFRWEMATAVAGSVIGIHAFNQPDVEASKIATRRLTEEYERTGHLPAERPFFEEGDVRLFADERNALALIALAGSDRSLARFISAHLKRLNPRDYFALLAYIEMNDAHSASLQALRTRVRDAYHVATCVGFGPRFLHSTGQAYKGGPNTGVFLQITCDDEADLEVPGQKYTFGVVKAAQARGDFQVLAERGRRALRVHLGPNVSDGLRQLDAAIRQACS
jgi:transaldolase / glucose-6-phosphate isomerase